MTNSAPAAVRPVGPPVAPLPSGRAPQRAPLEGAQVRLEPVEASAHADSLYRLAHARPEDAVLWTYLAYGPFEGQGAFAAWLAERARSHDPLFFALVEQASGAAAGMAAYMNIVSGQRHDRDRPHLARAAAAEEPGGDRGDLPARAPRVRRSRLPPAGVEVRCAERSLEGARRGASASPTRAPSASTWWSRAATATPPGSRCSIASGRRCAAPSSAGWRPPTSMPPAASAPRSAR